MHGGEDKPPTVESYCVLNLVGESPEAGDSNIKKGRGARRLA